MLCEGFKKERKEWMLWGPTQIWVIHIFHYVSSAILSRILLSSIPINIGHIVLEKELWLYMMYIIFYWLIKFTLHKISYSLN